MNYYKIINKYDDVLKNSKQHSAFHIIDNEQVLLENFKRIILFDENEITLELAKNIVSIVGLNLKMKNYNKSNVEISGKIHSINFDTNNRKDKLCEKNIFNHRSN